MTKPNADPVSLSQDKRFEIAEKMAACPFVGTAVASGRLQVLNSAENPLASIDEIARLGDLGGGDLGTRVLKLFARGNHSRWVAPPEDVGTLVPMGTFSLQFGGSQGAHAGHSDILLDDPRAVGRGHQAELRVRGAAMDAADFEAALPADPPPPTGRRPVRAPRPPRRRRHGRLDHRRVGLCADRARATSG